MRHGKAGRHPASMPWLPRAARRSSFAPGQRTRCPASTAQFPRHRRSASGARRGPRAAAGAATRARGFAGGRGIACSGAVALPLGLRPSRTLPQRGERVLRKHRPLAGPVLQVSARAVVLFSARSATLARCTSARCPNFAKPVGESPCSGCPRLIRVRPFVAPRVAPQGRLSFSHVAPACSAQRPVAQHAPGAVGRRSAPSLVGGAAPEPPQQAAAVPDRCARGAHRAACRCMRVLHRQRLPRRVARLWSAGSDACRGLVTARCPDGNRIGPHSSQTRLKMRLGRKRATRIDPPRAEVTQAARSRLATTHSTIGIAPKPGR